MRCGHNHFTNPFPFWKVITRNTFSKILMDISALRIAFTGESHWDWNAANSTSTRHRHIHAPPQACLSSPAAKALISIPTPF